MNFEKAFLRAVANVYRAREWNKFLPRLDTFDERERVVVEIPKGVWEVFESLAAFYGVPPNMLLVSMASAVAVEFLHHVEELREKSDR